MCHVVVMRCLQHVHVSLNDATQKNLSLSTSINIRTGPEQSMKPMIGKSIDQSITIDYLLVNWHRLASANR